MGSESGTRVLALEVNSKLEDRMVTAFKVMYRLSRKEECNVRIVKVMRTVGRAAYVNKSLGL